MSALRIRTLTFPLLIFLMTACSSGPEPIRYGKDKCIYCEMMIAEPNYGAELVTEKGRVHKFDAVECLINYKAENADQAFTHELAIAFDDPKKLHPIGSLEFVVSEKYQSPMGKNIAAFLEADSSKAPEQERSWKEVKEHVLNP